MTEKHPAKQKKPKVPQRRSMDEEHGRQAQLWWMVGVGMALLFSAYFQNTRIPESPSERAPAQLSAASPSALPYSRLQTK